MDYISTRGDKTRKSFTQVLMDGLAPDGGLYVPESWPRLDFDALTGKSYTGVALAVIGLFADTAPGDLANILGETYESDVFDTPDVAPLKKLEDGLYLLELFHGPTLAFKDVALQLLGRLFEYTLKKSSRDITIVGATSGDTGSAAIEACKARDNLTVFILHPHNRTSDIQRRQMTSVLAPNIHNIAVRGDFDDCQAIVKQAFADADMRALNISAINSINWARIVGQTVYYVHACLALKRQGIDMPSFAVPTGNFGNIYAAYVAKRIGAPIGRLIVGSNRNDVLTRFFETGRMARAATESSLSPSMDIQVSSNFERYLFELLDRDGSRIAELMTLFSREGGFTMEADKMAAARAEFMAFRASDDETVATIADTFKKWGEIVDPHTAVGLHAALASGLRPVVSLACAHPAKFPDAVERATGVHPPLPGLLADLHARKEKFEILASDYAAVKAFILSKQQDRG